MNPGGTTKRPARKKAEAKGIHELDGLTRSEIELCVLRATNEQRDHFEPRFAEIERRQRSMEHTLRNGIDTLSSTLTMMRVDQNRQHEDHLEAGSKRDARVERMENATERLTEAIHAVEKQTANFRTKEKALDFLLNVVTTAMAAKTVVGCVRAPLFWAVFGPLGGLLGVDIGQAWYYRHHPNGRVAITQVLTHVPDAPSQQPPQNLPGVPAVPLPSFPVNGLPSKERAVGK